MKKTTEDGKNPMKLAGRMVILLGCMFLGTISPANVLLLTEQQEFIVILLILILKVASVPLILGNSSSSFPIWMQGFPLNRWSNIMLSEQESGWEAEKGTKQKKKMLQTWERERGDERGRAGGKRERRRGRGREAERETDRETQSEREYNTTRCWQSILHSEWKKRIEADRCEKITRTEDKETDTTP